MSVRTFDGVDDVITTALGSLGFAFGPGTIAAIVRRARDNTTESVVYVGVSTVSGRYALEFGNAVPRLRSGASIQQAATITVTATEGWVLIAVTKASGGVTPRFHKYNFTTGVWTHENAGATLTNSGIPATSARIGATNTPSQWTAADIAIAAVANTVLSDAAIEALTVEQAAWDTAGFVALWPLDQASTATAAQDTIGAADQTAIVGTAVSTDVVPWTGSASTSDPALQGVAVAGGITAQGHAVAPAHSGVPATGISPSATLGQPAGVGLAVVAGIAPARVRATAASGLAVVQGVAPVAGVSGGAAVPPGVAVAAGVAGTGAVAHAGAGSAVAQGVAPAVGLGATPEPGVVVAAGVEPSAAASVPAPSGAPVVGFEPGAAATVPPGAFVAAGQPVGQAVTATPGLAIARGMSPSAMTISLTVAPGIAIAVGFDAHTSAPAGVAIATGDRVPPTARTQLTMGVASAVGVSPRAAAAAERGLAVAVGVTTGSRLQVIFDTHSSGHKPGGRGGSLGGVTVGHIQQPIRGSAR